MGIGICLWICAGLLSLFVRAQIEPYFTADPLLTEQTFPNITIIKNLLLQIVPGTNMPLFQISEYFNSKGCALNIHGGAARDLLLNRKIRDVDVDYSCNPQTMKAACVGLFGTSCQFSNDSSRFKIKPSVSCFDDDDDEDSEIDYLEGLSSDDFLNQHTWEREYTTNALRISLQTFSLEQLLQNSIADTCTFVIRPTYDYYSKWSRETSRPNNGIKKIPRYWKLASKGFVGSYTLVNYLKQQYYMGDAAVIRETKSLMCKMVQGSIILMIIHATM